MICRRILLCLLPVLLLSACEEPFEPLQEPDRYFSMYGALDLNADTQWIRVMPVRESILSGPEPIDASVTLEQLGTGRTVELRDSLFRYPSAIPGAVDDLWAHNFWTTEPIEPEASYLVRAVRSDGAASTAIVQMPPRPERVVLHIDWPPSLFRPRREFVRVDGVHHLAAVHVVHHVPPECEPLRPTVSIHQLGSRITDERGLPSVSVSRWPMQSIVCPGRPGVDARLLDWSSSRAPDLFAANVFDIYTLVSGSPWPFDALLDELVYTSVDVASNVENGVGFVGGVLSIRIPYDHCRPADLPDAADACELIHDEETALLEGRVTDFRCGGRPIRNVVIEVTEEAGFRTWSAYSDLLGRYRIGGLRPDMDYNFRMTFDGFDSVETPLRFEPGEKRVYDVALARRSPFCPSESLSLLNPEAQKDPRVSYGQR